MRRKVSPCLPPRHPAPNPGWCSGTAHTSTTKRRVDAERLERQRGAAAAEALAWAGPDHVRWRGGRGGVERGGAGWQAPHIRVESRGLIEVPKKGGGS